MTKRQDFLDSFIGLSMIIVIFWHLLFHVGYTETSKYTQNLMHFGFFFVMAFFYKGGMFFRIRPFKEEIYKDFRRLIVPFIVFAVIGYVFRAVESPLRDENNLRFLILSAGKRLLVFGCPLGNGVLWYLLSLFFVKNIYLGINIITNNTKKFITPVASIALLYILHRIGFIYPQYVTTTLLGLFFYSLGDIFRERQYNSSIISLCLLVFLPIFIFSPSFLDHLNNKMYWGYYPFFFISSFCVIVLLINFFKGLPEIKILNYVGKNSIVFLVCHILIIDIIDSFIIIAGITSPEIKFFIVLISLIITLPLLCRLFNKERLKWMIGG